MVPATRPFDSAEFLDSEEAIAEYVLAATEDGDASAIARALGVIARARGMSALARETGIPRTTLYKALSGQGNPELATVAKIARALGFRLTLTAESADAPRAQTKAA
ncbi:MAG TPA: putative addiction module antidote protein [Geminicoccaceae bacterium]|nr:putative addiction module antidote protein [Geminicoccus sp.]HMU49259.1 putative addiction module antidote protein [Geminicoccaceae bacterium]